MMPIKDIHDPWGGDDRVKEEVLSAISNLSDDPQPFDCIKCGVKYTPQPHQWIFYKLCDDCFRDFDRQKMDGRYSHKEGEEITHYEDVKEWVKSTKK